jgi:hypothetical protein
LDPSTCQPVALPLISFGWFWDIDGALPPPPVAIEPRRGTRRPLRLAPFAVAVTTVTAATPLRPGAPCGPLSPLSPLAP